MKIGFDIDRILQSHFSKKKEGSLSVPKQIGDKTQVTFSSNGTFKGNIEVTNTGDLVSVSKDTKGMSAQGPYTLPLHHPRRDHW
ncbi:MAG: hypothetical protein WA364_26360 [Candidatus Nitrosopolaris sp.]